MGEMGHQQLGHPADGVVGVIALLLVAITLGTIVRRLALRRASPEVAQKRMASLKTWWVLVALLAVATLLGRLGATLLFALASGLAFGELVRLVRPAAAARPAVVWAFGLLAVNYALVLAGWRTAWLVGLPVGAGLLLSGRLVVTGRPQDYTRSLATLYWGLIVLGYFLSHAPALFLLPARSNPVAGGAGWFLYLVVLTEGNDIAQALVGRRLGRRRITPVVSPHKTWEGFLGGVVITVILAVALAPWLTPWWGRVPAVEPGQSRSEASSATHASNTPHATADTNASERPIPTSAASAAAAPSTSTHADTMPVRPRQSSVPPVIWAALAGLLISIGGFFGDINMSAVKRDAGVKDSSNLLPGQGGVIDRIDALTFTSVLFYYYIHWLTI